MLFTDESQLCLHDNDRRVRVLRRFNIDMRYVTFDFWRMRYSKGWYFLDLTHAPRGHTEWNR